MLLSKCLAALSALLIATTSEAAMPIQPIGKWLVNFDDEQCIASRDYGPTAAPLSLVFKKPAIGDVLQVAVVWDGTWKLPDQVEGEVAFDDGVPIRTNFLEFGVGKLRQRALMMNLLSIDLGPMAHSSTLQIRSKLEHLRRDGSRPVSVREVERTFAISEISTVLRLLDECAADLRDVWKVWDENHDSVTLKKGPSADLYGIFRASDYPPAAIREDMMGTTTLVVLIDEKGKVADCTVTQTSGAASIDAQSCAIIRTRAKYRPAIGLDGKPTKSSFSQSITWRLEG